MPVSKNRRKRGPPARPQRPWAEHKSDGSTTVHLDDHGVDLIERQLQAFRDKFGREPGPSDPVFFDPDADTPQKIPLEKHHAGMLECLREIGAPPEIIYAFNKTDRVVLSDRRHMLTPEELEAWDAAVAEGREQHHARKYGERQSDYMLDDRSETPDTDGLTDPRSTEEIRADYLRGKAEHADDPLIVEVCDSGLALLDAEVALHEAQLGSRTRARRAVTAARDRMDTALRTMEMTRSRDQLNFLHDWKSHGEPH